MMLPRGTTKSGSSLGVAGLGKRPFATKIVRTKDEAQINVAAKIGMKPNDNNTLIPADPANAPMLHMP